MAVGLPILAKVGRKEAGKYFLTIFSFSGAVWIDSQFMVSYYKTFPS